MRKRSIIRDTFPDKARDFAQRVGDGLRHAPDGAGKWLQAGVALGAARTGARAAGSVARRHPVAVTAAALGIGVALYAVVRHRRKKKAEQAVLDGHSQWIRDIREDSDVDPHAADFDIGPIR